MGRMRERLCGIVRVGPKCHPKCTHKREADRNFVHRSGAGDMAMRRGTPGAGRPRRGRGRILPLWDLDLGPATLISDSYLQSCERTTFCCLGHRVCGGCHNSPRDLTQCLSQTEEQRSLGGGEKLALGDRPPWSSLGIRLWGRPYCTTQSRSTAIL